MRLTPARGLGAFVLAVCAFALGMTGELAGGSAAAQEGGPTKHFTLENPAELDDADAGAVYRRLMDELVMGYRLSGDPVSEAYPRWRRYNAAPYRSATHGERFVNNYVNAMGRLYGQFQPGDAMPVGSVIAKDSYAVTEGGDVYSGPLFLMEKMPAGFNAESRDWRYTMIMPDGSLFGVTKGPDAANVAFCVACHAAAGEENDHLFFVPATLRTAP